MIGGRWSSHGGEAGDKALFARRARALPAPELPSLEAILAKAALPASEVRSTPHHAGAIVGLAALAAACVGGLVVALSHSPRDSSARAIVADVDAGAPLASHAPSVGMSTGAGAGETCEPDDPETTEDDSTSCGSTPQASIVLASYDDHAPSCTGSKPASCSSQSGPLSCEHDKDLVCTP